MMLPEPTPALQASRYGRRRRLLTVILFLCLPAVIDAAARFLVAFPGFLILAVVAVGSVLALCDLTGKDGGE